MTSSAIFSDDNNYGSPRWTPLGLEVCVGLVESLLMTIMWTKEIHKIWRYDCHSGNYNLSNCKLTCKKNWNRIWELMKKGKKRQGKTLGVHFRKVFIQSYRGVC